MALARLFINLPSLRRTGGGMMLAVMLAMTLTGGLALVGGADAAAQEGVYKLCNETSYVMEAAVGIAEGETWSSRGWWQLLPGGCRRVLEETSPSALYFVHARSLAAHVGEGRQFFGDVGFCIAREDFEIVGTDGCARRNYQRVGFLPVIMTAGEWTTSLSEAVGWGRKQAQIAGLQRLLNETGFSVGEADGVIGGRTRRAIAKFRKEAGLAAGEVVNDELFNALIATRQEAADASGLTLCNRSSWLVWGAAGMQTKAGEEDYLSRGWIRVPAGECAKAFQEPLKQGPYYAYAEAVMQSGEPVLRGGAPLIWGGDVTLCTKKARFSITGNRRCLDRGFDEHGFATINPDGERHFIWTVE